MKYKRIFPKYRGKGNKVPDQEPTEVKKKSKGKSKLSHLMRFTLWKTD